MMYLLSHSVFKVVKPRRFQYDRAGTTGKVLLYSHKKLTLLGNDDRKFKSFFYVYGVASKKIIHIAIEFHILDMNYTYRNYLCLRKHKKRAS